MLGFGNNRSIAGGAKNLLGAGGQTSRLLHHNRCLAYKGIVKIFCIDVIPKVCASWVLKIRRFFGIIYLLKLEPYVCANDFQSADLNCDFCILFKQRSLFQYLYAILCRN